MLPICGGNWNNLANAGVFSVNLNNTATNTNQNVGCRGSRFWCYSPRGIGSRLYSVWHQKVETYLGHLCPNYYSTGILVAGIRRAPSRAPKN
jgi:hypothetical protein